MTTPFVIIVVVLVVLAIAAAVAIRAMRRRRLREQFGPPTISERWSYRGPQGGGRA